MNMREQTCCFTGHRDIPQAEDKTVMERTEKYVRDLVSGGVRYFGVGGAIGYDTETAKLLFRLRAADFPHIKVILVYPFDGYMERWTIPQKLNALRLKSKYDKIVKVSDQPGKDAYFLRDRHLVDESGCCVCYCRRNRGGTAYTVRYALNRGLKILNTADYNIMQLLR